MLMHYWTCDHIVLTLLYKNNYRTDKSTLWGVINRSYINLPVYLLNWLLHIKRGEKHAHIDIGTKNELWNVKIHLICVLKCTVQIKSQPYGMKHLNDY